MLRIEPIPAFADNYIWLLGAATGGDGRVAVVDPGDAEPVVERLRAQNLSLSAILLTHHHYDHQGGVADLLACWPDALVAAPEDRRIGRATLRVGEGDQVAPPGLDVVFRVLAVPGHTATHIAYLADGALFCGDTLFAGGCGRVFDGSFEQLAASLRRIAALPPDTRCYCAHEYTLANLGFAQWAEPQNPELIARIAAARELRARGEPTVPSALSLELATNPFLRTAVPAVIAAAEGFAGAPLNDETAVFTALRRWKDERYD
ncbi:MAG: hydroxyacylglutathione hydrolase [Thiohalocapsa sp.]|uniref:hydroxyacylglutathione hydrolase n=1 Tax=Thiohalocapsa sp. TaxID=2497641 RepID=UPI0025FCC879|nr:hydroxyacylglutathione hydrolase [Thiohalocapsa sp.]MCG6939707.1 hydroxyacylglutathione hydrolase [Thiohalocapsa sp.]